MSPQEFLEKVICPSCRSKLDLQAPFNNGLVCKCRLSLQKVYKASRIDRSFKLYLTSELLMHVSIYSKEDPWFYIASEDRPFYPLYQQREIPDYIFMPVDILIPKIELLTTFS